MKPLMPLIGVAHVGEELGLGAIGVLCHVARESELAVLFLEIRDCLVQLLGGLLDTPVEVAPVGEQRVGHSVEAGLESADLVRFGGRDGIAELAVFHLAQVIHDRKYRPRDPPADGHGQRDCDDQHQYEKHDGFGDDVDDPVLQLHVREVQVDRAQPPRLPAALDLGREYVGVFETLRHDWLAKIEIVRDSIPPECARGGCGHRFPGPVVNRGHDDFVGSHRLVEQALELPDVTGVEIEFGGTGDLAGDDLALAVEQVVLLVDAVVDVGEGKEQIDQQHRDQRDQQDLVLDTEFLHNAIRSRRKRRLLSSGRVRASASATLRLLLIE